MCNDDNNSPTPPPAGAIAADEVRCLQKYWAPNDEREKDRLDLVHNLYLLTFDYYLGTAPPTREDSKVGRVLDVGTGTGLWAIEFGEDHPEAEVTGVDLSASQPSLYDI
ncbi:hypothetical protein COL516b_000170 [Colletotrichum fioriniae]|nr:uncharacterized protein COL516b_000170 [Colletotrichum fioriniae]KAJ0313239.1 hypothetical protein COL516b_000170 [Colletotrichum fioriniae]